MKRIKKGYRRLSVFLSLILIILLVNSFMSHILDTNKMILFLMFLSIIFEVVFGFEKDKHRYLKPIVVNMLIYLIIYFILYYLFGILIGFAKVENYFTWYGIKKFIVPIIIYIFVKEFLRYGILCKSEGNKKLIVYSTVIFIIMDISSAIAVSNNNLFLLISLSVLPAVSNNILCSYLAMKVGYKINILYLLIINLYSYLLPIVPNPNEYLKSVIEFILPIILLFQFIKFFDIEEDYQVDRDYKKIHIPSMVIPLGLTIVLTYFTSGYFTYHAIAIASGSMRPNIDVGDVVIVKQKSYDYKEIGVGDIVAYKSSNTIIVHRVVRVLNDDGRYYFYTKGDANNGEDNIALEPKDIIGVVQFKVKMVGLPTIWLSKSLK